jgi:tetrapyrrole methylase family protein / MazG family protein
MLANRLRWEDGLALLPEGVPEGLQLFEVAAIARMHYPGLNTDRPALLMNGDAGASLKQAVKVLRAAYPANLRVVPLGDGGDGCRSLGELGDHDCVAPFLLIPPAGEAQSYGALQEVVARLRAPDGCPWDRELTWGKLRETILEEGYELLDALDAGAPHKVAEELGDLLLQVALVCQIAVEEGSFGSGDVMQAIVSKLIRRHPHVFGDAVVSGTEEVLANWEAIKRAERAANHEKRSPLASIPRSLPALSQAFAYVDRLSRVKPVAVPDSPWQLLAEQSTDAALSPEVLGRALWDLVVWSWSRGVDAESALRATNTGMARQIEHAMSEPESK